MRHERHNKNYAKDRINLNHHRGVCTHIRYYLGYAMIHEYRMYLENHWKARYSFRDFIKMACSFLYGASVP